jgi:hypothetical protein
LEDILPFFPDFTLIDDFKDEICKSLEEYKTEIDDLKKVRRLKRKLTIVEHARSN